MPSPRKQAQGTIKAVSPTVKYKKYSTTADPRLGSKVRLPRLKRSSSVHDLTGSYFTCRRLPVSLWRS